MSPSPSDPNPNQRPAASQADRDDDEMLIVASRHRSPRVYHVPNEEHPERPRCHTNTREDVNWLRKPWGAVRKMGGRECRYCFDVGGSKTSTRRAPAEQSRAIYEAAVAYGRENDGEWPDEQPETQEASD